MKDPNRMPTERELASSEMLEQARKRGEKLGFEGQFLDCFIEREIQLMHKWRNQSSFATIDSDRRITSVLLSAGIFSFFATLLSS